MPSLAEKRLPYNQGNSHHKWSPNPPIIRGSKITQTSSYHSFIFLNNSWADTAANAADRDTPSFHTPSKRLSHTLTFPPHYTIAEHAVLTWMGGNQINGCFFFNHKVVIPWVLEYPILLHLHNLFD
jgi:hypothetical protein